MRYLLVLLLTTTTLFAQHEAISSNKYIWAKAGLVLRAEGSPQAEKLTVIPYGATVQLTGARGEDLSIGIIPIRELDGEELPDWKMHGQFVGVRYGDLKGYVFDGYISNYHPEFFYVDALTGATKPRVSVVDTLHSLEFPTEYGEVSVLYDNGITANRSWSRIGGSETIVVPNATLATGYLLAAKWYNLDDYDPNRREWDNAYLMNKTHDSLTFKRDLQEITIKEYFGVVIILYDLSS